MNTRSKFDQTVENLCEHEVLERSISAESMTMIKEISYSFLTETLAKDLELFGLHAKRVTIKPEDVLLCARKNEKIRDQMENYIKKLENTKSEETKKTKTSKPKARPKSNNNNNIS